MKRIVLLAVIALALAGCSATTERRALYESVAAYNTLAKLYHDTIRLDKADGSLADEHLLSADDVRDIEQVRRPASEALDKWRDALKHRNSGAPAREAYQRAYEEFYQTWLLTRTEGAQ